MPHSVHILAAVDAQVLIWVVLGVFWAIAQVFGQIADKKKKENGEEVPGRGVPPDIRKMLDEIKRQTQAAEEPVSPPPVSARPVSRPVPPVPPRPAPSPPQRAGRASSSRRSISRRTDSVAKTLTERKNKFQSQLQRRAHVLAQTANSAASKRMNRSGEIFRKEGQVQKLADLDGSAANAHLSSGLLGFRFPSISLPSAGDLSNREVSNPLRFRNGADTRRALLYGVVIGPPVANEPPGSALLTRKS